jgi:Zn finger protein HypA/HybF involved in hydrogenase expression
VTPLTNGEAMHEYGLVEALLGRVETEAHARNASAVHRLTVRIGPLVNPLVTERFPNCL